MARTTTPAPATGRNVPASVTESDLVAPAPALTKLESDLGAGTVAGAETKAATFDWDELSEPSVVEYSYASPASQVDWEAETPEAIKMRVKASYAAYEQAYKDAEMFARKSTGIPSPGALPEGSVKRIGETAGRAASRKQAFKSQAQAEQFLKLARGYAASLGYTFRCPTVKDGQTELVYRVKPKEVRTRNS